MSIINSIDERLEFVRREYYEARSKVKLLEAQLKEAQAKCEALIPSARIVELAQRLVAAGPKAAHVSCSETHEISDFILESACPNAGQKLLNRLEKLESRDADARRLLNIARHHLNLRVGALEWSQDTDAWLNAEFERGGK